MSSRIIMPLIVAMIVTASLAAAEETKTPAIKAAHWDYGDEHGPTTWGGLDPAWATCSTGRHQSPIDLPAKPQALSAEDRAKLGPAAISVGHAAHIADVLNNGHTVQVNYAGADTLALGGKDYTLVQYHFHSPSEHTVGAKSFPMEMHLVHKSADGELAVVGVLIEQGKANAAFNPVWAQLPEEEGADRALGALEVDVDELLPKKRSAYRYSGSLTTPPCSEGVTWFVMTAPIHLSAEQIDKFREIIHDNNRPTQPANGRWIAKTEVAYP